ncbi:Villin-1 [Quillaja saponaria]|uniref:Villin-1 n=1 Tax=Quillaja saponaria TaxID=32244 RepID=A0AAD7LKU7_QUISA|nr:Villin-1 [Quillaja saponaria]
MALFSKDLDSVFLGAGEKAGLEIWCIESLRLFPIPKSSHGKFYTGSAYLVLNTVFPKTGPPQHDIHYWLGNDSNKEDSGLASDKALELDAALGSCSVQYREIQALESQRFLSYFKPCIIPVEGVYTSQKGNLNGQYQVSLLTCKGDHVVRVKEVSFSRSSLNHDDVFILDTASKIFLFSGCNSSIQERAKALDVVQYIKENKHNGNCEVATLEDGKFVGDTDVGEFWSFFGGYAPIPRNLPSFAEKQSDAPFIKLFWITTQGKLCQTGSNSLNKDMLETNKCYMLDCGAEIFVWMGRQTSITERKTSTSAIEGFLRNDGRSNKVHLTFLSEGLESASFMSHFGNWPKTAEPKLYEEGREKVAAIFKQQGFDVKELPAEDSEPFIDCGGTLKVWRVNGDELSLLSDPEQTKLFSGDCYIIHYTFPDSGREANLFYAWLGCESVMEDRTDAISRMNAIVDSIRGNPAMAQVIEGNEPVQFFLIFQRLIIFKGGMSARYKKFIAEKVDQVSTSLNSSYCYILQTGEFIFSWIGSLSSTRDHNLLDKMLELLNPALQPVSVREGSEPDIFWNTLGGKAEYPREKEIQGYVEDPHMFALSITEGDLKVKELYNFTQDDLATEDIFVLDCQQEIYVWIGINSTVTSKQEALRLGLKFLEMDVLVERLSLETPIYIVTEGHEPSFFTRFFSWDSSKTMMHGNSFERKLAILKGKQRILDAPNRNLLKVRSRETTPDGLRSISVSSNGWGSSTSASSVSGTYFNSSSNGIFSSPTPTSRKLFSGSSLYNSAGSSAAELRSPSENVSFSQVDTNEDGMNLLIYPYERLKVVSKDQITGIDRTKREMYLSDREFQEKFRLTKQAFYELPKWKQNKLKMSLDLF